MSRPPTIEQLGEAMKKVIKKFLKEHPEYKTKKKPNPFRGKK